MEITKDGVLVRAPLRCSKANVQAFVNQHIAWAQAKLAARKPRAIEQEYSPEGLKALKQQACETLLSRAKELEALTGLHASGYRITQARTRFGSCSGKNAICFSCYLVLYPEAAIDYVILHELAHTVHKNHGKAFYALVESFMPCYKAARALLKE